MSFIVKTFVSIAMFATAFAVTVHVSAPAQAALPEGSCAECKGGRCPQATSGYDYCEFFNHGLCTGHGACG